MLAAGQVIAGCPVFTPRHAVRAEVRHRACGGADERARGASAVARAPAGGPLRATAEATAPERLTSVTGRRELGRGYGVEASPPPPHLSRGSPFDSYRGRRRTVSSSSRSPDVEPLLVGAVAEKRKAWLHPEALPRAT